MLIPLLVLALQQPDAKAIIARYEDYLQSAKTLKIGFQCEMTGVKGIGVGSIMLAGKQESAIRVRWAGWDFGSYSRPGYTLMVEGKYHWYDEFQTPRQPVIPADTRISVVPFYLPLDTFSRRRFQVFDAKTPMTVLAKTEIGGVRVDHIHQVLKLRNSTVTLDGYFAADGKLVRATIQQGSASTVTMTMTDYQTNVPISPSVFRPSPPVGYVAYSMPFLPDPMDVDFPPASPAVRNLVGQGHVLVAIMDTTDPRQMSLIAKLEAKAKSVSAHLVKLSLNAHPTAGWTYDKAVLDGIHPQGTPEYMLFDKGSVTRAWIGYHAVTETDFGMRLKTKGN